MGYLQSIPGISKINFPMVKAGKCKDIDGGIIRIPADGHAVICALAVNPQFCNGSKGVELWFLGFSVKI